MSGQAELEISVAMSRVDRLRASAPLGMKHVSNRYTDGLLDASISCGNVVLPCETLLKNERNTTNRNTEDVKEGQRSVEGCEINQPTHNPSQICLQFVVFTSCLSSDIEPLSRHSSHGKASNMQVVPNERAGCFQGTEGFK